MAMAQVKRSRRAERLANRAGVHASAGAGRLPAIGLEAEFTTIVAISMTPVSK